MRGDDGDNLIPGWTAVKAGFFGGLEIEPRLLIIKALLLEPVVLIGLALPVVLIAWGLFPTAFFASTDDGTVNVLLVKSADGDGLLVGVLSGTADFPSLCATAGADVRASATLIPAIRT